MKSAQNTGVHLPIDQLFSVHIISQTFPVPLRDPKLLPVDACRKGSNLNFLKHYSVRHTYINVT